MRVSIVSGLFVSLIFSVHQSATADSTTAPAPPTDSIAIRINEIYPNPKDEDDEWIELYNFGSSEIDLSKGWKLKDKATDTEKAYDFSKEPESLIRPGEHLLIERKNSKIELNNSNETVSLIRLDTDEEVVIDSVSYGTAKKGESYSHDGSSFRWSTYLTPGAPNRFEDTSENDPIPSTDPVLPITTPAADDMDIRINELFPNPKEGGEKGEFIELRNLEGVAVNISGFLLRDASKSGKYVLPAGSVIAANGYLAVPRAESGLSLNNTDETVSLFDPSGNPVDSASYGSTKEEASYSHDGSSFRWSRYLTPGAVNRFGDAPSSRKTDIPKKAYKDVPATFSASGSGDRKYFWDFGDGGTSRKQEATHTYEESGEYPGTLTISEGVEETVKTFTVDVEKFPKRKVSIAAVSANPTGDDAESEWISIRNKDRKKIDFLGWSIATGPSRKKVSDHPIRESFVLKPGEERTVTREVASFSLPNENGYVELRQPDGKVLAKTSYAKEGGVKEDEVWRKQDGGVWTWIREKSPNVSDIEPATEPDGLEARKPEPDSLPSSGPETMRPVTLDDLSPEDLSRLEAQAEEKVRRRIFAELLGRVDAPSAEGGAVLGVSDEHGDGYSGTIFRTLNQALIGILSDT